MNRKKGILAAVVILVILAGAWWLGSPGAPETVPASSDQEASLPMQEERQEESAASAQKTETETAPETAEPSAEDGAADQETTDKPQTQPQTTAPADPGKKEPVKTQPEQSTCTLTIRCDTLVGKPEELDKSKAELVPADGLLYSATASAHQLSSGTSV